MRDRISSAGNFPVQQILPFSSKLISAIKREAGGVASLSGALTTPVLPANSTHLTLSDIQNHAILSTDIHACPTRVIALENTLAGTILPLADCQAISAWARKQEPPILMHLDGARLWEAVAAQAGSPEEEEQRQLLKAYSQCFDSVSLCFSKGLGAPIGSIIVGSQSFITRARWIRKSIGGGLRQSGVIASAARVAVEETFLGGLLRNSHVQAKKVAEMWTSRGGKLLQPTETNMAWLDLAAAGISKEKFVEMALAEGVKVVGGRLVVHYRTAPSPLTFPYLSPYSRSSSISPIEISPAALTHLAKVMDGILSSPVKPTPEITNGAKHEVGEAIEKGELME